MGNSRSTGDYLKDAMKYFDPSRRALARAYRPYRYAALASSLLFDLVFVSLFMFTSAGPRLLALTPVWLGATPRAVVWASIVVLLYGVLGLPLSFVAGYVWPRRFGLVHHSERQWLKDRLLSLALAIMVGALGALVFEWLLINLPALWWLYGAGASFLLSALATLIAPVLLMPLFNKFTRMPQGKFRDELLDMARRSGTPVTDVFIMDMSRRTTTANAMLAGLGKTRRMIVGDTLLSSFPPDEVKVVMAHELAHHHYRHIPKSLGLAALCLPPIFWITQRVSHLFGAHAGIDPPDPAFLGIIAGTVWALNLLGSPAMNRISRYFEWQSDEFSLRVTGLDTQYATMIARLYDGSLGDTDPPWVVRFFLYSHPPATERIAHALEFARRQGPAPRGGRGRECGEPPEKS